MGLSAVVVLSAAAPAVRCYSATSFAVRPQRGIRFHQAASLPLTTGIIIILSLTTAIACCLCGN